MLHNFNFMADEDGAVTVDWVVLTAAIIGLGVAVMSSVGAGSTDLADDVQANLTGMEIASYLGPPTYGAQIGFPTQTSVDGACRSPFGFPICDPARISIHTQFAMSDDTIWTSTRSFDDGIEGMLDVTTWADADGNPVDAPDAT